MLQMTRLHVTQRYFSMRDAMTSAFGLSGICLEIEEGRHFLETRGPIIVDEEIILYPPGEEFRLSEVLKNDFPLHELRAATLPELCALFKLRDPGCKVIAPGSFCQTVQGRGCPIGERGFLGLGPLDTGLYTQDYVVAGVLLHPEE